MTGWRIGWLVLPPETVRPIERLAQNLFISAPYISQIAAEAAFDCHAELQANVARYRWSRDHLLAELPSAGFNKPSAAEGSVATRSRTSGTGPMTALWMLDEAGVALSPGADFDRTRGNRFVRFSYCGSEEDMRAATTRLRSLRSK